MAKFINKFKSGDRMTDKDQPFASPFDIKTKPNYAKKVRKNHFTEISRKYKCNESENLIR